MKYYLDEDISPRVAERLREKGLDALSAHDVNMLGVSDGEQLDRAVKEGRAMVTRNVYHVISLLAKRNRRSLQQQILFLLERAQSMDVEPPAAKAADIRQRLQGRPLGDTVKDIREDRDR